MPSSTSVIPSPLEVAKNQANLYASMTRLYFKQWLECHRKLFLLAQCARYEFFTKNSIKFNALILKDLRCKPLREYLQDVLKMQRRLKELEKKAKEMVKKEREGDARFWAIARTMRQ